MTYYQTPSRSLILIQLAVSAILLTTSWASQAGWRFSNERVRGNEFKDYIKESDDPPLSSGVYLSVGGDRAFTGAALAAEAGIPITGILRFDIDPAVLLFGDHLFQALSATDTPETLLHHALTPFNAITRLKHKAFHSRILNHTIGWRTLYTDEMLFQQLRKMKNLPSKSFQLNLNNRHSWAQLIKDLEDNSDNIAVLDISNLLQGYVHPRQLETFLATLSPFMENMEKPPLIRETLFFNHPIGHYQTRIQPLSSFLKDIYTVRPSNIYHLIQQSTFSEPCPPH